MNKITSNKGLATRNKMKMVQAIEVQKKEVSKEDL
jgi:hypothetical protein